MTTNQTIDSVPREQMACMPVERCYDARAKMIIAFNEAKKAGGDLDDALEAAYKSALRYSPNPLCAEQPAPVAVVLPEHLDTKQMDGYQSPYDCGWNACLDEVTRLNQKPRMLAFDADKSVKIMRSELVK